MRHVVVCVLLLVASACGRQKPAVTAAQCAATQSFYEDAASRVVDAGLCDPTPNLGDCLPYRALEDAYVASMEKMGCPSPTR